MLFFLHCHHSSCVALFALPLLSCCFSCIIVPLMLIFSHYYSSSISGIYWPSLCWFSCTTIVIIFVLLLCFV
jgi:hypothetical protein